MTTLRLPLSSPTWKLVGEPAPLAILLPGPLSLGRGKAGTTGMGPAGRMLGQGSPSPALLVSYNTLSNMLLSICASHFITNISVSNVDCEVSSWVVPTECSASCGEGKKSRERRITTQPRGAGAKCPNLRESIKCNNGPCPGMSAP